MWGAGFGMGGFSMASGAQAPVDLIAIVCGVLGAGAVLLGAFLLFGPRPAPELPDGVAARATLAAPRRAATTGPAVLRARASRGCALTLLLPISTALLVGSYRMLLGDPDGGLRVFGIALLVLGLLGGIGVLHVGLSLLNPRAEVVLESAEITVGTPIEVPWRLVGSTSRLSTLRIELIGREEASYQRGTTRQTDRHDFFRVTLMKSDVDRTEASGHLRIEMPPCAVPSFSSRSNQIRWFLRFHAPIRWWPDVRDEIEIPVGPSRGGVA